LQIPAASRSFDCDVVREANDIFAQDDRFKVGKFGGTSFEEQAKQKDRI